MRAWVLISALGLAAVAACADAPPNELTSSSAQSSAASTSAASTGGGSSEARQYFDENIEPIFEGTCADCHANGDDPHGAPDFLGSSPETYYDTITSNPILVTCDVQNSMLLLKGA